MHARSAYFRTGRAQRFPALGAGRAIEREFVMIDCIWVGFVKARYYYPRSYSRSNALNMRSRRVSPSPLYISDVMLWKFLIIKHGNLRLASPTPHHLHGQIIAPSKWRRPGVSCRASQFRSYSLRPYLFTSLLPVFHNAPHPAPPKAHPVPHSSSPKSLPHSHPRALPATRAKPPDAPCPLPHGQ